METKDRFDEIISILGQELDIHNLLIKSAEKINDCVRRGDHETLSSATVAYDEQICRLEKVEEHRIECCLKACKEHNLNTTAKISSLLQFATEQSAKHLENIAFQLKEKVKKLSAVNESNKILLQESLNVLGASFEMIKESSQQFKGYRHRGDQKPCTSGITIFNQVI